MYIKPKVGIALCGGGARGAAHIGVLKALEEHGISPEYVSGTSAGAIMGALYSAGNTPEEILSIAKSSSLFKVFNLGLSSGLSDLSYLRDILKENFTLDDFSVLQKKLFVAVTNLNSGEYEILDSGKLSRAVIASCAIPLLFTPVIIDQNTYVDGGFINNLPVEPLQRSCDLIIGVNVNSHDYTDEVKGMREVGVRCFHILLWKNTEFRLQQCHIPVEIPGAFKYGLFDFKKSQELSEVGYEETIPMIPTIREKIAGWNHLSDFGSSTNL